MLIFEQVELWFLALVTLGAGAKVWAQQELRQTENNRIVLELPTINFTRIYNEVPLFNFSRLYSRLFNSTKEKSEETSVKPTEAVSERQDSSTPPQIIQPYKLNDPAPKVRRNNQFVNLQIPNQPIGQQLFAPLGYGYGVGARAGPVQGYDYGVGAGQGYTYGYPDYAQIYGSSNYNSIPAVQVLQQPGFDYRGSNYYNYVSPNTDVLRAGYQRQDYVLQNADLNEGRGQLYADFGPYRQWPQWQQHQQLNGQSGMELGGSLDYGEEEEDESESLANGLSLANEYDEGDGYGFEDYSDLEEGDYDAGDEVWRQANGGLKVKTKTKAKSKPGRRRLKTRPKKQRVAKRILY